MVRRAISRPLEERIPESTLDQKAASSEIESVEGMSAWRPRGDPCGDSCCGGGKPPRAEAYLVETEQAALKVIAMLSRLG
jgi:hypothetical protein